MLGRRSARRRGMVMGAAIASSRAKNQNPSTRLDQDYHQMTP